MKFKIYLGNTYFFVLCVIAALLICYQAAFKKTVVAWNLNRGFHERLTAVGGGLQPQFLQRHYEQLKATTQPFKSRQGLFRSMAISEISLISEQHRVTVKNVAPEDTSVIAGHLQLQQLTLNGTYPDLLRVLNKLQQDHQCGFVRSVVIRKQARQAIERHKDILPEMQVTVAAIIK